MNRAVDAIREWLQLRQRLRDEHQFHVDCLTTDFRSMGLSGRAARRAARRRFGSRYSLKSAALREIGGNWATLPRLFFAHRVHASPWFHPTLLTTTILLVLLASPAPLAVIEGVVGRPLSAEDRGAVFISQQSWNLTYVGINKADFESIRSLDSLMRLGRHQSIHARAQLKPGVSIAKIESLVQARTGNRRLRVVPLFERDALVMGPAKAVGAFIGCCGFFFVASFRRSQRWLGYGMAVGCLHLLTSFVIWALGIQVWNRVDWSTDGRALLGFLALVMVYLGLVAFQFRVWWHDLRQRCPCCLETLLLPLTEGSSNCFLLNSAITESICAHGHGVLVETRWSSRFQSEESPLQNLVHG